MPISRKKTLILSGIFVLITLIIIVVFVCPALNRFNKYVGELKDTKRELAMFNEKSSSFYDAKKNYISWQPSLDKVGKLFINKEVPIDFIKFLEKISRDCNLRIDISSTSVNLKSETEPWNSISFEMNLIGSFDNLMEFLQKLETSPYLINEQGLVIRNLTSQEANAGVSVNNVDSILSIKVYTK